MRGIIASKGRALQAASAATDADDVQRPHPRVAEHGVGQQHAAPVDGVGQRTAPEDRPIDERKSSHR
jgi:hypothetical protein